MTWLENYQYTAESSNSVPQKAKIKIKTYPYQRANISSHSLFYLNLTGLSHVKCPIIHTYHHISNLEQTD